MPNEFEHIVNHPANQIFQVVFFPDRVYHARYLNAARSVRYRYNVREVRAKADAQVMKGEVYMDGARLTNFLRIEYRAARLVERAREMGRHVRAELIAEVRLPTGDDSGYETQEVKLVYCPFIDAFQTEIWASLEPLAGRRHDWQVLQMMGAGGSIARVSAFDPLIAQIDKVKRVRLNFRENDRDIPTGWTITNPQRDNFYDRNLQVPNTQNPSSDDNTVKVEAYTLDFRRGWYFEDVRALDAVRYRNALMNQDDPARHEDNVVEMRWVLQQELGASLVFFHEVCIPQGKVEGAHQHIGSEELYYITEGEGVAYISEKDSDDPALERFPIVERSIFGLAPKRCREVPVKPGACIFTKSGGVHGIENTGSGDLRFVAFLYHSS